MATIGYTDEDFEKASASAPDDDGCAFVDTPHEHDDRSHHVQVPFPGGWTQCLISGYLNRWLKHISGFPRPIKKTEDKVYRVPSSPGHGLGMFATHKIKMSDLISDLIVDEAYDGCVSVTQRCTSDPYEGRPHPGGQITMSSVSIRGRRTFHLCANVRGE